MDQGDWDDQGDHGGTILVENFDQAVLVRNCWYEIFQFSEVNFASFDTTLDFEEFDDYSSSGSFSSPEEDYGSVNNASEFTV